MAGSVEVDRAVAVYVECQRAVGASGEGERAAAGSGGCERAAAGSGDGEHTPLRSLDYPCTARLRLRRLLAYLRGHSYNEIYEVANEKLCVIFHVKDLVKKIKAGEWREAFYYVRSFAPFKQSSNEAKLLVLFLQDLMAINSFADGHVTAGSLLCDWFMSVYRHSLLAKYPCFASLVDNVLFLRSDLVRDSLDWQLVRNKAAEIVEEMAYKTPELKDRMHYPRGQNNLHNVVPVGSSLRRRRQVKNLGHRQPTDLAQFYIRLKNRLPSSTQRGGHVFSGSPWNKGEVLIALLEKALEAGRRPVLKQGRPHESEQVFPLKALLTHGLMVNPQSCQRHIQTR